MTDRPRISLHSLPSRFPRNDLGDLHSPGWSLRTAFLISGIAMTALLSTKKPASMSMVGVALAAVILQRLAFGGKFLEHALGGANRARMVVAAILSIGAVVECTNWFREKLAMFVSGGGLHGMGSGAVVAAVSSGLGLLSLFSFFVFLAFFLNKAEPVAARWVRRIDGTERLYMGAMGIALLALVVYAYGRTNMFYLPRIAGVPIDFNVVFSSDSGDIFRTNAFMNVNAPQNDFRQPLFGLFALPFATIAYIASRLLFFVPNALPLAMAAVQIPVLMATIVMVARLLELDRRTKFLALLVLTLSYPTLLFSLMVEQYVFAVFWMVSMIYASSTGEDDVDLYIVPATGSLLTSGALGLFLNTGRGIRGKLEVLARSMFSFAWIAILFGKLPVLLEVKASMAGYLAYTGKGLPLSEKALQFLNFVGMTIVRPFKTVVVDHGGTPSFQLAAATAANPLGIVALALAISGFLANHRNRLARVGMGWIAFSFVLLCLVGWGTAENGLVLYSLYFSWAYIALVILLVEKMLQSHPRSKLCLYIAAICALICVNAQGIRELLRFGIDRFPAG